MIKQTKLAMIFMLTSTALAQAPAPKNGFIPDEKTAIKVAEAILPSICGESCAARNRPFVATLDKGIWTIYGNPPHPAGQRGGGAVEIHIDQHTGAILSYVFAR